MRILITGSNGFIGKNLLQRILSDGTHKVFEFNRNDSLESLPEILEQVDFIFHLAGENRPKDSAEFENVNVELTKKLCDEIVLTKRIIPLIFTSSTQASTSSEYGKSKLKAENIIQEFGEAHSNPCLIYRLPGVFGKWCKPNYNSVVATFCNNIARDLTVDIHDPHKQLSLVYIDDVVNHFYEQITTPFSGVLYPNIEPEYHVTIGVLAESLYRFRSSRTNLITERVGTGFTRALYSTYLSFLPKEAFSYSIASNEDERGVFAEILKTPDCGQFSFFTALPGVTRGGHYHESKSEKFLVVSGSALFRFRHIISNETLEIVTTEDKLVIVESIPGWAHDITNAGSKNLIVLLWANEVFESTKPDTFKSKL
jgi:UDP-2-acetamido-2,6-beta-L-arabino-hexul-4-ose reductase